jgi:outer membrane autotransporter protein
MSFTLGMTALLLMGSNLNADPVDIIFTTGSRADQVAATARAASDGARILLSGSSGQVTLSDGSIIDVTNWTEATGAGTQPQFNLRQAAGPITFTGVNDGWAVIERTGSATVIISTPGQQNYNSDAILELDRVILTKGERDSTGGAISSPDTAASGTLTVRGDFVVLDNHVKNSGAGIYSAGKRIVLTGSVVFDSNKAGYYLGDIYGTGTGGGLAVTGGGASAFITFEKQTIFDNNVAVSKGGGVHLAAGNILAFDDAAFFRGNKTIATGADAGGGAVYMSATASMTVTGSSVFKDNASNTNGAGIHAAADAVINLDGLTSFDGNIATGNGAAVSLMGAGAVLNVNSGGSFTNNSSGGKGGAIYAADVATVNLTATDADIVFEGNKGGATVTYPSGTAIIVDNAVPTAAGGVADGIYFEKSGTLNLTASAGRGIHFNDPVSQAAGQTAITVIKSGSGMVVFSKNADIIANTHIQAGAFLLTGSAIYGTSNSEGSFELQDGAVFKGEGTIRAATVTARTGAVFDIGQSGTAGVLTIDGSLTLETGVFFEYDLFSGNVSDKINVGSISASGTSFIDISSFTSGSYNLGNIGSIKDYLGVTLNGGDASSGRNTATLDLDGTDLLLIAGGDRSRVMTWTGSSNNMWDAISENWTGSDSMTQYSTGDRIVFDGSASGTITMQGAEMRISDMVVSGGADYRFGGAAGISAAAGHVVTVGSSGNITDAEGKLKKSGAGTLTFANTGSNQFEGGIEHAEGVIAFSRGSQIRTTGTWLKITGDATLRALADMSDLANAIAIETGKTATLDTQGFNVTYSGALTALGAGAKWVKSGSGKLVLTADSSGYTGATVLDVGRIVLNSASAKLGGTITIADGAVLAGIGTAGDVTVNTGGVTDIGLDDAAGGLLTVNNLTLEDGGIIRYNLINLANSDKIQVDGSASVSSSGTGIIQIAGFASGTYNLGNLAGIKDALTLVVGAGSGRQSGVLSVAGADLLFEAVADKSRVLTWTGSGSPWDGGSEWGGGANEFARGDIVVFGNVTGASVVDVPTSGVDVASMSVDGTTHYTFQENGGIRASGTYVSESGSDFTAGYTADGKLRKTGTGRLTFANTGINVFAGGIEIGADGNDAGVIEFGSVAQIGVPSTAVIHFAGSGSLRAAAALSGTLAGNITVADGKTGTLDYSGTLVYNGIASGGGKFAKEGSGELVMGSTGRLTATAIDINSGVLRINGGMPVDVGTLHIKAGASLRGSGTVKVSASTLRNSGAIYVGRAGGAAGYGVLTIDGAYTGYGGTLYLGIGTVSGNTLQADKIVLTRHSTGTPTLLYFDPVQQVQPALPANVTLPDDIVSPNLVVQIADTDNTTLTFGAVDWTYHANSDGGGYWKSNVAPEAVAATGVDAASLLIGKASLSSLANRLATTRMEDRSHGLELWINGLYRNDDFRGDAYWMASAETSGLQVGGDITTANDSRVTAIGLFYDYAENDMHLKGGAASAHAKSSGVGVYGTVASERWHIDLLMRGSREDYEIHTPTMMPFSTDGDSWASSVEAGYVIAKAKDLAVDLQAQLTYQAHSIDDATDEWGRVYHIDGAESLDARMGLRFTEHFDWTAKITGAYFIRGSYVYDFKGDSRSTVESTTITSDLGGSTGVFDAGLTLRFGSHVNLNIEGGYYQGTALRGFTFNGGLSISW